MSNVIFSPFYKSHPVFKADQVLSDVHLNDMLEYLEKENTQTRSQLIGSGIIEGFAFQSKQTGEITTLNISNGKGVTSSGQLIIQEHENGFISYSNAIEYKAEHLVEEFPDIPEGSVIYALVPDLPDNEEVPEGIESLTSILKDKPNAGLAVLQESVDIQIQSCFITNCDERGAQRKFTIKHLLILAPEPAKTPDGYQPTLRRIERIQFDPLNDLNLLEVYEKACSDEYIEWLELEIRKIGIHLIPGLKQFTEVSLDTNLLSLKNKRNHVRDHKPQHIQYFYDFLIDLSQTVEDIIRLHHKLKQHLYPLTHRFSHHLMLGQIAGVEAAFNRNYFQPALYDPQHLEQIDKLARNCNRLGNMLNTFLIPVKTDGILIHPTNSRRSPIEETTVPFYYSIHKKTRNWKTSESQNPIPISEPLNFFHDDRDALLIEGLIGLNKNEALKSIKALRTSHHLTMGLVALRVSEKAHNEPYPLPKNPEPGSISEYNFEEFATEHPGLYHSSSVPKGGTLTIIFKADPGNTDGQIVGTLVLPYVCCGRKQTAPEPDPFVLKAVGDQTMVLTGQSLDITILDNDQFDKDSSIEVDFVYDLVANNDQRQVITSRQIDIQSLQNDLFDKDAHIEVDLIEELEARNVSTKTLTDKSIDIDVLKNDNIAPGPIELDFDKDN